LLLCLGLWAPGLLALSLLLASCATLPSARPAGSPWAPLPADGDLYLYADVRQTRGLLEPLAARLAGFAALRDGGLEGGQAARNGSRLGPLLDRSEEVYACLRFPGPAAELAVTGRWSPNLLAARLDWSCGWVRHQPSPDSPPYWSERRSGLEVGSPARGLLLAASGQPGALQRMTARRLSPQAGPVELVRDKDPRVGPLLAGAALYAFLPAAAGAAGEAGGGGGLPVRELWLAAQRGEGLEYRGSTPGQNPPRRQYELSLLASLAGPSGGEPGAPNPRALTALVRLVAAGWLRKAGIPEVAARLRQMEVEVNAGGLAVRGLRLAEPELLALLQSALQPAEEGSGARGGD
jgi:hypothetical protein